jgi:hypothetical protein
MGRALTATSNIPWLVMARAEGVATKAFAAAGIEVRWVKGQPVRRPPPKHTPSALCYSNERTKSRLREDKELYPKNGTGD